MYDMLDGWFDPMPEDWLECDVDGRALKDLKSYRAQSKPYWIYVPEDNVQNDLMDYFVYGEEPPGVPYYAPGWHLSISDGYYAILKPLPAGKHTIHLRSSVPDGLFCEVTYELTVKGTCR